MNMHSTSDISTENLRYMLSYGLVHLSCSVVKLVVSKFECISLIVIGFRQYDLVICWDKFFTSISFYLLWWFVCPEECVRTRTISLPTDISLMKESPLIRAGGGRKSIIDRDLYLIGLICLQPDWAFQVSHILLPHQVGELDLGSIRRNMGP